MFLVVLSGAECASDGNAESVEISSDKHISYFSAPLTKKPLASWMEIQKGIYPKVSPIHTKIKIGELVTLLIYFNDPNDKYDISIEDCWAFDNADYNKTKNKLNLLQDINMICAEAEETTAKLGIEVRYVGNRSSSQDNRGTRDWIKVNYPKESNLTSILYSTFSTFKFPDTDKVYLTCNVKLCYYRCSKQRVI